MTLIRCGAQGRNRTTDTAIFSRMLYQLSYLGTSNPRAAWERRFIVRPQGPVHLTTPSPKSWLKKAIEEAFGTPFLPSNTAQLVEKS